MKFLINHRWLPFLVTEKSSLTSIRCLLAPISNIKIIIKKVQS